MVDLNVGPINPGNPAFRRMLGDLQGNILKSHGRDHSRHLFLRFTKGAEAARQVLGGVVAPAVTTALQQFNTSQARQQARAAGRALPDGGQFVNIMLTHLGYELLNDGLMGEDRLRVPDDAAFQDGLKVRRKKLDDPDVDHWDSGYRGDIHAHLLVADAQLQNVDAAIKDFRAKLEGSADVVAEEVGFQLRDAAGRAIEHFGYVDGRSQPLFFQSDVAQEHAAEGIDQFDPAARLTRILVHDPNGRRGGDSCGSYFVFRKLEQNVRGFMEAEQALAKALEVERDLAGAFAVGRFRDGTPVVLDDVAQGGRVVNNFNYAIDPDARKCPFHAHIRKMNPRGDIKRRRGSVVESPRFFARRGITYGDPGQHPSKGVGLLFMCFNNDIKKQFEFVQRNWANGKLFVESAFTFAGLDSRPGIDPLIGQGDRDDAPKRWPRGWDQERDKIEGVRFSHFVNMKGGEYFFAPSRSFLESLA